MSGKHLQSPPAGNETQDLSIEESPAVFIIITASPLWCAYKTGRIDDFFVGKGHVILSLAPPRTLWYPYAETKFSELVSINDNHCLSFGGHEAEQERSSGLEIGLDAGTATLRYAPASSQEDMYVEVGMGPSSKGPLRELGDPRSWETSIQVQKIEVYSLPDGVEVGLSSARGTMTTLKTVSPGME
ncbi:hypothetical protein LTR62_006173 [Meristemomyces frigidus]|uniref:Uncharacterized protein n=1 Tax=Meristemomyces frigidus TaxID=1508187 RepID=A0AAN7TNN5_9PEZI|nr:hypothetical protein LTR62_006173 [Meristemomyces frigidus]